MKTKLMTLLMVAIAAVATSCGSSKKAMQSSGVDKSAKEYIAEQVAEWKAEGYKQSGASVTYSLEELMARHRSKMELSPDKYYELFGVANAGAKSSLSALKMMALNDAAREYATKADLSMKGKMGSHFNTLADDVKDVLTGSFIAEVSSNIIPFFSESFAIEKTTATSMELRVYYIIDEEQAAKVREAAANTAVKKSMGSVADGQELLKNIEQAVAANPL